MELKIQCPFPMKNVTLCSPTMLPNATTPFSINGNNEWVVESLIKKKSDLGHYLNVLLEEMAKSKTTEALPEHSFGASKYLGLKEIREAEESNHFGQLFEPRLKSLMFIMKHSSVLIRRRGRSSSLDIVRLRRIASLLGLPLTTLDKGTNTLSGNDQLKLDLGRLDPVLSCTLRAQDCKPEIGFLKRNPSSAAAREMGLR